MNGARELGKLFGQGEFRSGKLLIVSGKHARGRYFHIYTVGDDGSKTEVYGILGGQPGWTEYYGWLHKGKWQDDFFEVCKRQQQAVEKHRAELMAEKEARRRAEEEKVRNALAAY
mgnify:FL=1